jgi:hypothetical protein
MLFLRSTTDLKELAEETLGHHLELLALLLGVLLPL